MTRLWQRLMDGLKDDSAQESEGDHGDRVMIAGLGNPGRKHRGNRHNIGFMAVDRLAEKIDMPLTRTQNQSVVGSGRLGEHALILAKPQTYMNRSGEALGQLARYYKILPAGILVVYDDLDLPFGALRLRQQGGAGGHNGMRSIIQHIGDEFPRLRLGIGRPPGRMDPAAFVLQDFRGQELETLSQVLDDAVAAIKSFIYEGIDLAMTWHNKK